MAYYRLLARPESSAAARHADLAGPSARISRGTGACGGTRSRPGLAELLPAPAVPSPRFFPLLTSHRSPDSPNFYPRAADEPSSSSLSSSRERRVLSDVDSTPVPTTLSIPVTDPPYGFSFYSRRTAVPRRPHTPLIRRMEKAPVLVPPIRGELLTTPPASFVPTSPDKAARFSRRPVVSIICTLYIVFPRPGRSATSTFSFRMTSGHSTPIRLNSIRPDPTRPHDFAARRARRSNVD